MEHSRGIEYKRRKLNDSVRVRSWCPPTHHHDYDLRRWWRMVETEENTCLEERKEEATIHHELDLVELLVEENGATGSR